MSHTSCIINDIETKHFMQSENNIKIDSLLFVASTIKRRLLVPISKEDDYFLDAKNVIIINDED